jgi:fibronectin type 3 domain-containing protein
LSRSQKRQPRRTRRQPRPIVEQLERRELLASGSLLLSGLQSPSAWQFVAGVYQDRFGQVPTSAQIVAFLNRDGRPPEHRAPGHHSLLAGHGSHFGAGHHAVRQQHLPPGLVLDLPNGSGGWHFDFGGALTPVATGYVGVSPLAYNATLGYGWASPLAVSWTDRSTSNALTRDFHWGVDATFLVNLPNGIYNVTPTLGDARQVHNQQSIYLQGQLVASGLTTGNGQFMSPTYQATVNNGQLQFRITGGKNYFALDGLTLVQVGPTNNNATAPLAASAGASVTGNEGSVVSFAGSVQGGTAPYSETWNFGDGTTATGTLTPTHSYADNANYTVTLTVQDGTGATTTSTTTASIVNVPPTVTITGAPASGHSPEGTAITLGTNATDPSSVDTAAGFTYAWNVTKNGAAYATGTGSSIVFTPNDNATYVATVTATDKDGGVSTPASTTITVDNVPPTVTITGAPASAAPGTAISLGSTVSDPSTVDTAAGFTYAWNLGDGSTAGTASVSHTYAAAGIYTVTLSATDKDGGTSSPSSATITVTSSTSAAPSAPSNLAATVDSPSEINLTWDLGDATDTAVIIERAAGVSGSYQTLATLPGGENTFTDTSCWASTTYTYRVKARNAAGDSGYSALQSATTQPVPSGALNVVANLQAVANSPTTATISFTDTNTANGREMYILERSADGVSYQVVASLEQTTSWIDTGRTPGATYSYRVLGTSWTAPTSDYSPPAAVTMPARPQGAPIEPSGLQASDLSASSVLVNWTNNDPSNPPFEVDRAVYDPWHPMTWVQVGLTAAGATSFTDTGLTAESAYAYRVRAVNAAGASDYSVPASDVMHSLAGAAVDVATASAGTASPRTYDIGPGLTYTNIADLDWTRLGPGDTVNIHYKPGGYHELFQISTRGTAAAWITVNGVPDPSTGALPVIDGYQAVLAPQFVNHYAPLDGSGAVIIGTRPGYTVGYKPGYILIQNLQFEDCYQGDSGGNTFTDYDSSTKTYGAVGAGIYLERADHVTIKNDVVTNNGEGIFGAGQSGFDRLMTDITLNGNYIYGNGNIGSYHEHNTYMEGIDTVYQFNHYGPLRSGSGGAGLKDRSVGAIIRYNYIEGGAHQLQLPEAQNQSDLAMTLPEYHKTFVYGNVLVAPPGDASSVVYFGGDQGLTPFYRKGILYLYNNTLIARSDQSQVYKLDAVELASTGETVDARNNILAAIPNTQGATHPDFGLLGPNNNAYFGRNWVTPGYYLTTAAGYTFTGHAAGAGNLLVGATIDPGFVDLWGGDYRLATGSACTDVATQLPGTTSAFPVNQEYLAPQSEQARPVIGTAPDLGAFEYGTYTYTPPPPPSGGQTPGTAMVVDDLQAGYTESGTDWIGVTWFAADYSGECRLATTSSGTDTATWQVTGLTAGNFTVQASWVGYHNNGTTVPYRVYDGNTLLAEVRVDQTVDASGATINGTPFQTLGTFSISSGTLRVVLGSDNANGYYVAADAVRIVSA